jgi:hypothetical protein
MNTIEIAFALAAMAAVYFTMRGDWAKAVAAVVGVLVFAAMMIFDNGEDRRRDF